MSMKPQMRSSRKALALGIGVLAFTVWAVSPHYQIVDKEDLTECDSNCNGRCVIWRFQGKCLTCKLSMEEGENQCTPRTNPPPITIDAEYQPGQCGYRDRYGLACKCYPNSSDWYPDKKECNWD